jgi:UDP-N-acetylglucosamine--N-acetylmuramyl-(pentapeptide) pyrophosphoryl-undecaprenol N-acetylglucosamine transferase
LFPGIAVAKELEKRSEKVRIIFVVGRRRMESEILRRYGYRSLSINVEGLKGRGWKKGVAVLSGLPRGVLQSASIIKKFSPALVLGVGAYSSGPFCLTAKCMGVPTAIHEQNSYPGLTNRLLARVVDRVFVSFEESRRYFKARSVFLTGNPIRNEIFSSPNTGQMERKRFTILVVGGSQGARAINKAFVEAMGFLKKNERDPEAIHQSGDADYSYLTEEYRKNGFEGDVQPFIHDMARAYNRADLVVSRAGATTIFELAALGKPSVLIPYPYAANRHQEINAGSLVRSGGAEMICQDDLTGEVLGRILMKYMDDKAALEHMSKCARKMGMPDAGKVIVDHLLGMIHFS